MKRSRGEASDFSIENAFLTAKFSGTNGLLQSLTTKEDSKETEVSIEFVTYGTVSGKSKSGAYLFLPDKDAQVNYCLPSEVDLCPIFVLFLKNGNTYPQKETGDPRPRIPSHVMRHQAWS